MQQNITQQLKKNGENYLEGEHVMGVDVKS